MVPRLPPRGPTNASPSHMQSDVPVEKAISDILLELVPRAGARVHVCVHMCTAHYCCCTLFMVLCAVCAFPAVVSHL